MSKMYMTSLYSTGIEEVETRETPSFLYYRRGGGREMRVHKESNERKRFHNTWEEAHAALLDNLRKRIDRQEETFRSLHQQLTEATKMVKP